MAVIRPWGQLPWLLSRMPKIEWSLVGCASFEERCIAAPRILAGRVSRISVLRIDDPPNRFSEEVRRATANHERAFRQLFPSLSLIQVDLLGNVFQAYGAVRNALGDADSVILDISALPKRFFLFIIRRLLADESLRNLVVTYTPAAAYPEGALTQDANPIDALPGFARIGQHGRPTLIVSVGYVTFDINQLIQQAKVFNVKFLFPFPPGSPAFRRNWRLLDQLIPDIDVPLEIWRVHALDTFEALSWLREYGAPAGEVLDMVPLGPKPHALAMALAYGVLGDPVQILYPQPTTYRPDYSLGIKKNLDGSDAITGYCLRKDGTDVYLLNSSGAAIPH